ncbi:MAG: MFS transporter [Candidatus Dormibacteraeota bacterium]|nr:MFS transporter [Candidatus Dormibacteraeota bacterium]
MAATGTTVRANGPLFIYLSAASLFAAMMARNFLLPLRVHELGGSRLDVGLLSTTLTLTAAVLSLPAGYLSDRLGKRALVVGSALTGGLSQLGLALAPDVGPMYAWQVIAGVSNGASQAGFYAALAEVVPRWRLGRAYGWLTLGMQIGFLTGPALAGLTLNVLDLRTTLLLSSALYVVPLVLGAIGVPTGRHPHPRFEIVGQLGELMRRPGLAPILLGLFAATLVWGTQQAYLPLFAIEQLRLPETVIGYMVALLALSNGLARLPVGRLIDRFGPRLSLIAAGVLAYSVALAVLPHLGGFWAPTLILMAAVPLMAVAFIATTVGMNDVASDSSRGIAMGLYSAVLFLGIGLGPAVFGAVAARSGYATGFSACAVTGLALVALMLLVARRPRQRLAPARTGSSAQ